MKQRITLALTPYHYAALDICWREFLKAHSPYTSHGQYKDLWTELQVHALFADYEKQKDKWGQEKDVLHSFGG